MSKRKGKRASANLRPFKPETAPRKGRVKGSRNKATPRQILEAIVAHACELHGKARIPRLQQAMTALFLDNELGYVKAVTEASVRLHGIEAGGQLGDDGRPVVLTVRWGSPSPAQIEHQKYALELQAQKPDPSPPAVEPESPPPPAPAVIDKDRERLARGPWLSVV